MEIIDDVKSIVAKSLKIPVERLTPDARLDQLGAESLEVVEIVFELEEKFDISIPFKANETTRLTITDKNGGDEMEFSTIGDLANAVKRLVEAKAS
ncbi:MAG: acyl carrier protein [Steroidobacteraceae bacterium]